MSSSLWPFVSASSVASASPATQSAIPDWMPVDYPIPAPGDGGSASTDAARFARYVVRDELVLPKGYRYDVIASWGDLVGPKEDPSRQFRFGFAADYTGLQPIAGTDNDYFLIVNHEYISGRPWIQGYEEAHGTPLPLTGDNYRLGTIPVGGGSIDLSFPLDESITAPVRAFCDAAMRDLGLSVLHVRRTDDGRFHLVADSDRHLRVYAHGTVNIDPESMRFTGPASSLFAARPRGTFSNCSGATTPWGTFLSCEENTQDQTPELIDAAGRLIAGASDRFIGKWASGELSHPTKLPFEFEGLGTGVTPPLDGREYGWVVEVDPATRSFVKHTALGRFRHENVALRAKSGKPLAAYLGDDRRGGHVWKFISNENVINPKDHSNTKLLADGTLYAARFHPDYRGEWVAIAPSTPLVRPEPQHCTGGYMWLPSRPDGGHVAVGTAASSVTPISVDEWVRQVEAYAGKPFDQCTLADLVDRSVADPTAVLMLDAFAMANAVGATPVARPEDVEIHPIDGSIYVAFTDNTGGTEGSPDARIFPDSQGDNSRQYGAIYRMIETDNATTFEWGKFVSSGELHEDGGAFASADNLVFDPQGNLWMVCDITTPRHNNTVTRTAEDNSQPGSSAFMGAFGNNAMFCIPTTGPHAGVPRCFAIGPMECELTGPTWTDDGKTLVLAVQHPGELHGTRGRADVDQPLEETRAITLATRDGTLFQQERVVPIGSNFPAGAIGTTPRPCVLCITAEPA